MPAHLTFPSAHPHVAVVTIHRPERANSLDPPTLCDLARAWQRIAEDDDVRCAILTATGDRVFCSGMDMTTTIPVSQRLARGERIDDESFEGLRAVPIATLAGFDVRTPIVCAVNGHCRAIGLDMMLATEIRLAVPSATFALEEVARGLYPTGNATVLLARQIGWVHANELLLTAQSISAQRALEIGLINEIVDAAGLLPAALRIADTIAGNAPLAVRATRAGVREMLSLSLSDGYRRQEEIGRELRKSEDAREAQLAFVEKRGPVWKGR